MHAAINALIIAVVVVLVIVRRFTPRRLDERRPFVLPAVLVVIAAVQGTAIDARHVILSAGLLAAEIGLALLLGAGLGATMRVWTPYAVERLSSIRPCSGASYALAAGTAAFDCRRRRHRRAGGEPAGRPEVGRRMIRGSPRRRGSIGWRANKVIGLPPVGQGLSASAATRATDGDKK